MADQQLQYGKRICLRYSMDRVSFCNISVIQQDTQYLVINFIHNIQ